MRTKSAGLIACATIALTVTAADWPQWRGLNRDGAVPQSPPLNTTWANGGPAKVWESEEIPGGGYGSVVVSGGHVYIFYYKADTTACTDGFFCVDAAGGKTAWKKEFKVTEHGYHGNSLPSSTPCVFGGRLYCIGGAGDAYCLDATTGAEVWKAKADSGVDTPGVLNQANHSSFMVCGELAVLESGLGVTAFDAKSGSVVWKQEQVKSRECSVVAWTKDGQTYLLCNTQGNLHCLESKTGKVDWSIPAGELTTPLVSGNTLVVQSATNLSAYKLGAGKPDKPLWTVPFGARGCSPLLLEGHVYSVTPADAICVNLESGKPAWDQRKFAKGDYILGSPLMADRKIIANMNDGSLLFLKATPEKFEILGQPKIGIIACCTPAVVDGKMYLRTLTNHIACFDLAGK
jgi:outer membrane protein assembly factor BamB